MRVTDVLCLGGVTIRTLVYEWLDAEGLTALARHALELQEARQVLE